MNSSIGGANLLYISILFLGAMACSQRDDVKTKLDSRASVVHDSSSSDVCGLLQGFGVSAVTVKNDTASLVVTNAPKAEMSVSNFSANGLPGAEIRYPAINASDDSVVAYQYDSDSKQFFIYTTKVAKNEPVEYSEVEFSKFISASDSTTIVFGSKFDTSTEFDPEPSFVFAQLAIAGKITSICSYTPPCTESEGSGYLCYYSVNDTLSQNSFLEKALDDFESRRGGGYHYRSVVHLPWGVLAYLTNHCN